MTRKRMSELLAKYEPKLRRRFWQILQRTQDRWTVAALESALESGTLGKVINDIETVGVAIATDVAAIAAAVGSEVAHVLSDQLDALVAYDGANVRAVAALQSNKLRMVQALADEQRAAFTNILSEAPRLGLNPRQVAVALRDSIGLTENQERWVRNYRAKLERGDLSALDNQLRDARYDAAVERAASGGKPLSPAQIDRMVERYRKRAIKYRSEVVARTEVLRAVHAGADDGYQQAIASGVLDRTRVQNQWHTGPRARDWHATMNGQLQPFGQPFVSGQGTALRYPGDPDAPADEVANCNCARSTRVLAEGETAVSSVPAQDESAGAAAG